MSNYRTSRARARANRRQAWREAIASSLIDAGERGLTTLDIVAVMEKAWPYNVQVLPNQAGQAMVWFKARGLVENVENVRDGCYTSTWFWVGP
jgi:hypothetical protein